MTDPFSNTIEQVEEQKEPPRSLAVARRGIKTSVEFAEMMSSLMSDLIEERVTPQVGNATVNAGGKLLKMVEMQLKYGTSSGEGAPKSIQLVPIYANELPKANS